MMCKRFKMEKRKGKLDSKSTTKGSPSSSKKIKKNNPQKGEVVEKKIYNFEIETSLKTKGNNQYDSKIKEKYLIKDENMITQNKKVQVIGVNNNIPSSQNVQEKKNVFINSPKEYGTNLLNRINIFFIFCSIQFKARFAYDKKKYQCYKG